jgi:single-strand DNA-binding protein
MNSITIVGRLCSDPRLSTTSAGKNVAEIRVAVDKRFKPKDGGNSADFFTVKVWGQDADFVNQYIGKGRLVAVNGRIESREYTNKEGHVITAWEITSEAIKPLDRGSDKTAESTPSKPSRATAQDIEDIFADE